MKGGIQSLKTPLVGVQLNPPYTRKPPTGGGLRPVAKVEGKRDVQSFSLQPKNQHMRPLPTDITPSPEGS
ncbi:MAG: hypothetical protein ACRC2V_03920 [Xenococcaceae cyanobacterium]